MQASWGAPHLAFPPTHHLPTLFNIIKAWRGLTRIPPKRGENTPRFRANPPKGERIPLESPANPPANPPATSPSPKQGKSERFPGVPSELLLRVPLPHRHDQCGVRSGSSCGVIIAASTCASVYLGAKLHTAVALTWATGPRESHALARGAGQERPYTSHAHCTSC